jgi:hypothetical protein
VQIILRRLEESELRIRRNEILVVGVVITPYPASGLASEIRKMGQGSFPIFALICLNEPVQHVAFQQVMSLKTQENKDGAEC